jgi:hypothetical protein
MIGPIAMAQREILDIAPAVRLACQEGNAFGGCRSANERREIGRQRRQGQLVDEPMAFVIPGESGINGK